MLCKYNYFTAVASPPQPLNSVEKKITVAPPFSDKHVNALVLWKNNRAFILIIILDCVYAKKFNNKILFLSPPQTLLTKCNIKLKDIFKKSIRLMNKHFTLLRFINLSFSLSYLFLSFYLNYEIDYFFLLFSLSPLLLLEFNFLIISPSLALLNKIFNYISSNPMK